MYLIPLDRLVFATHDMTWTHVDKWINHGILYAPPVLVEKLDTGHFFIHDGRHRATAAYELGHPAIKAVHV